MLGKFMHDPLGHVMTSYPWDEELNLGIVEAPTWVQERYRVKHGPDEWACQFLAGLGERSKRNGFDKNGVAAPIRAAVVAGHGVGKSTMAAWIVRWLMDTRPAAKGLLIAPTNHNLTHKTWEQLQWWHQLSRTRRWYSFPEPFILALNDAPSDVWCRGLTGGNYEEAAGICNAYGTTFYVLDEAAAIPDKMHLVCEGGMTDGEAMMFKLGCGHHREGQFYRNVAGLSEEDYSYTRVNAGDTQLASCEWLDHVAGEYGVESDIHRVRVQGLFPAEA